MPTSRPWILATSLALAGLAAHAAPLTNDNIDERTTLYVTSFSDLTFAGASNARSDLLQFHGSVGDAGTFGIVGLTPGKVVTLVAGPGMTVDPTSVANAGGVANYGAAIVGTAGQTITQSWINNGPLQRGVSADGLNTLTFTGANGGFLRAGGGFEYTVSLPGDWSTFGTSTGQVQLLGYNTAFTITQDFTYDAATQRTSFQMVDTDYAFETTNLKFVLYGSAVAAVPEPGTVPMLLAGLLPCLVLGLRRRRR